MAGVSTPAMAAAVANAGALGSLGVGATDAAGASAMVADFRERSRGSLNVNVFCHAPAKPDPVRESAWIARLRPEFARLGAAPPDTLREIYRSFLVDDEMLAALIALRPKVVSFHFGHPSEERVRALRDAGIVLLGSATSLDEGQRLVAAGVHAVVAQGWEAGGHRGVFDPDAYDSALGTLALTRLLVQKLPVPVIAAGGIMDGAGIVAALKLGAAAAQLGTAFITTTESQADAGYRRAMSSDAAHHTRMTRVVSGRPARILQNRFAAWGDGVCARDIPDYPIAYDLGKALHAAGKRANEHGFGAQWAGQGAPLARERPAAALVRELVAEMASSGDRSY